MSACRRSCCWHFDQERFCTYFERPPMERTVSREPLSIRDVVWAGTGALPILAPWSQSVPYLAEVPS